MGLESGGRRPVWARLYLDVICLAVGGLIFWQAVKSGYQVVRVPVDAQGRAGAPEAFVQGWLKIDASGRETVWGRPADVLPLPDGSLLISGDLAGAI